MNLDYVFMGGVKEFLSFFTGLDDFMEAFFGNKEIEFKIDMLRLIIRMTNASVFVEKIYQINILNIRFL